MNICAELHQPCIPIYGLQRVYTFGHIAMVMKGFAHAFGLCAIRAVCRLRPCLPMEAKLESMCHRALN